MTSSQCLYSNHKYLGIPDDSSEPFEAKIVINDKSYGTAQGVNKKAAKNKAALETMEMLAPGFKVSLFVIEIL